MPDKESFTVRLEPVGLEMQVEEDETILDAAFRQGIALMHGCKEGQCGSCKAILTEGDAYEDVELMKFSTFALPDSERDQDHVLLCRTQVFNDISIELLNYDEELLARSIPVAEYSATVLSIEHLTHDIRRLDLESDSPIKFWAGQYVDITLETKGITRAFSMANPPSQSSALSFIIKKYPDGEFSSLLDGDLTQGDKLTLKGPYGTCSRREGRTGSMILVGGGSGMSPLWSILKDQLASGENREMYFFYGARTEEDLFYLDEFAEISAANEKFTFIPALSESVENDGWSGETGFIHEVVERYMQKIDIESDMEAYTCGPPPMIDAVLPVFQMNGIDPDNIHFDKFTPSTL